MASEIISIGLKLPWIENRIILKELVSGNFREFLSAIKRKTYFEEAMAFHTPYHFEGVFVSDDIDQTIRSVKDVYLSVFPVLSELPKGVFFEWERGESIRHFFEVLLGIGTPIIGDVKFLENVKEGYTQSLESELTGPVLNRLFQSGVKFYKSIVDDSSLFTEAVTIESAIVELGRHIFGNIRHIRLALVGDSAEGPLLYRYFRQLKFKTIQKRMLKPDALIPETNRNLPNETFDILVRLEQKPPAAAWKAHVSEQLKPRRGTPLLIIDLTDQAPEKIVDELLFCYNRDDLQAIIQKNFNDRQKEVPGLLKRLEKEVEEFISWQYSRERFEFSGIIGKSRKLQQVLEMIARVSTANTTVLIEGESGTGKELVAKAIHKNSPRAEKSFIVVNCAAISETLLESELFGYLKGAFTGAVSQKKGLFEEADQGTVFLDEIGEMSPATQAKILRVIQEGEVRRVGSTQTIQVDVRVIAATNKNLKELVKQHKFREDLYYRLKVLHIVVPPLRLRKGDVPELADYFLEKLSQGAGKRIVGITQEAMALLQNYPWPGNVRELENAIERAVIMTIGQHITPTDLPREIQFYEEPSAQNTSEWATLYEVEKQHILKTLEYYDWNLGKVTEVLGISRATLWRKLKEYGIQGKENK